MLLGCTHRFNPGAGIIGQLSFDNSQLPFPETTEFISVVIQFQPNTLRILVWRVRALNCVGAWVRLKVKHHRDELSGFWKWQLRIVK
jgi:hypothetical protein